MSLLLTLISFLFQPTVDQLGDPRYRVRKDADETIRRWGFIAYPAVWRGCSSQCEEIRMRCQVIEERLEFAATVYAAETLLRLNNSATVAAQWWGKSEERAEALARMVSHRKLWLGDEKQAVAWVHPPWMKGNRVGDVSVMIDRARTERNNGHARIMESR